ncbi:hypothetical protein Smp_148640 [Schistosoma mansoni]|uniref:hypothetical protein n=1 Tax=Schistosoma mansoni TaxID=6183 RepID=UPI0001A634E9|nr:hypothetical protein Smp_148640 [Schistosoma mansoni]|eukprot:XP_018649101.1 hypothetical protein Smp_148640 [Schistosoma mansoni]
MDAVGANVNAQISCWIIQIKDIKKSNDPNLLSDSLYAPGKKVRRRHLRQDFITQEQFRKRSE